MLLSMGKIPTTQEYTVGGKISFQDEDLWMTGERLFSQKKTIKTVSFGLWK